MRAHEIQIAFDRYDSENRRQLSYSQIQDLLMSFGVRPSEQDLDHLMSKDGLANLDRVKEIVEQVIPVELMKARVLRAFMGEDARQERKLSGDTSKTAVDGLIDFDFLRDVLGRWKVAEEVMDDAFQEFVTPDGQLEYCRLVDALWD